MQVTGAKVALIFDLRALFQVHGVAGVVFEIGSQGAPDDFCGCLILEGLKLEYVGAQRGTASLNRQAPQAENK
ncbi:Hypothetical protein Bdt_1639 [Bdellovibrio bacteriovorus str. Tiberius]|uniref:Uncharacterized protein n=1 Tax=Bdellovibrio bacteriovorus str. Tiberius TaxID=1069642 RepID=K7Z9T4_BDEBC|nr:Hypothetical protein Bdt_1639 [Bdellovibrio bacteriovorus str. Tiberius]